MPWRPSQLKVKARTFFAEVKLLSRDARGGEWAGEGDGVCASGVLWGVQRARQNQELNYSMSAKRARNHRSRWTVQTGREGRSGQPCKTCSFSASCNSHYPALLFPGGETIDRGVVLHLMRGYKHTTFSVSRQKSSENPK